MIKAILFDRDGTLLDSKEANKYFCRDVLWLAGYKNIPEEKISESNHLTFWDRIKFLTGETDEEKIKHIWDFKNMVRYKTELLKLGKDEVKVLKQLSKRYFLSIVTNATKYGIENFYEVSGLKDYFMEGVSFDDFTKPKPDPEPLLIACKKLKIKPKEAIYVGDSLVDLQAAKAINMKFIGFYGISGKIFEEADANVKTFSELFDAIEKLANN